MSEGVEYGVDPVEPARAGCSTTMVWEPEERRMRVCAGLSCQNPRWVVSLG